MFADERKTKIEDMLKRHASVTTSELTEAFGVSVETIRRDLEYMESQGLLKRVHGGAVAMRRLQSYTSLSGRRREHQPEKHSLALKACSYIKEGDFIALDAGSTTYELAALLGERFRALTVLTHSLEVMKILEEKENFFRNMRIHLIQCDCAVQEHVCVTCEEEWKAYLEKMEVKGHGDTDFTPVFRLVDQMKREGELSDLKGLLYFTDGDGIYPEHKPDYETAFVFLNEELMRGKAPAWAQTLTLDIEMEWETGR